MILSSALIALAFLVRYSHALLERDPVVSRVLVALVSQLVQRRAEAARETSELACYRGLGAMGQDEPKAPVRCQISFHL